MSYGGSKVLRIIWLAPKTRGWGQLKMDFLSLAFVKSISLNGLSWINPLSLKQELNKLELFNQAGRGNNFGKCFSTFWGLKSVPLWDKKLVESQYAKKLSQAHIVPKTLINSNLVAFIIGGTYSRHPGCESLA